METIAVVLESVSREYDEDFTVYAGDLAELGFHSLAIVAKALKAGVLATTLEPRLKPRLDAVSFNVLVSGLTARVAAAAASSEAGGAAAGAAAESTGGDRPSGAAECAKVISAVSPAARP